MIPPEARHNEFWAVQGWLDQLMPLDEQMVFKHWYSFAKRKAIYVQDARFYRPGQQAGLTLLFTISRFVWGNTVPKEVPNGGVPAASRSISL